MPTKPNPDLTIETRDLTREFDERVSVNGLNLAIGEGELYALLGDNGAGKTTTINMLTTLLPPTRGEFYICGISGLSSRELIKASFGIVSQEVSNYQELTAYENLRFVAELYGLPSASIDERIVALLDDAGLLSRANDRLCNFSGGMQRKLSIACALLPEPRVLFMDEPTVGLDPGSRRQIWQTLKKLKQKGVTILLTTHYLEEAEILADRIGIIREGSLVVEGTIGELRQKIKGIRSIAIRLSDHLQIECLAEKIEELEAHLGSNARLDKLHNTVYLSQPPDRDLATSMKMVLDWLGSKQIAFSSFSTSEPSLEEIFLAISESVDNSTLTVLEE